MGMYEIRKDWQARQAEVILTMLTGGAIAEVLLKPSDLTGSSHPTSIKSQIIIDRIMVGRNGAGHDGNESLDIELYDGDPAGAGLPLTPQPPLRGSISAGGTSMVDLPELRVEVGKNKPLWLKGFTTTTAVSVKVHVDYHLEDSREKPSDFDAPIMLSSTIATADGAWTATFDRPIKQGTMLKTLWTLHDAANPYVCDTVVPDGTTVVSGTSTQGAPAGAAAEVTYTPGTTPDLASARGAYQHATQSTVPVVT